MLEDNITSFHEEALPGIHLQFEDKVIISPYEVSSSIDARDEPPFII